MVVKKIMFFQFLSLVLFSFSFVEAASQIGSQMTTSEEVLALMNCASASSQIEEASSLYSQYLNQYQAKEISWIDLETKHKNIFSALIVNIQDLITSSEASIHAIANDFDAEHQAEYVAHIQTLIGIAQEDLNIPADQVFLPPLPSDDLTYPNLIEDGEFPSEGKWSLSSGNGTLDNGQIITDNPNGASFSQVVKTTPGSWYIISTDVTGAYEGVDKYGNPNPYSGSIAAIGANAEFPQVSNELDQKEMQRRYFWVQASSSSMTITISGSGVTGSNLGPIFQNVSVRDLKMDCSTQDGQSKAMALAQLICPPVYTAGSPSVGWYPQVTNKLESGDNLLDGEILIMKNVDQSALGNAGHPYWYFYARNPANQSIKIVNGLNGANGLFLPAGADPTTNGPLPIPNANYNLSFKVDVPNNQSGNMRVTFSAINLNSGLQSAKFYQDFTDLPSGLNALSMKIPSATFSEDGTFFRPSVTFANTGSSPCYLYDVMLVPSSLGVYSKINAINPYNPSRSWYNPKGCNISYNFQKGNISTDFGIALTGNTMFSANPNYVSVSNQGIVLNSNCQSPSVFEGGGIQSTQLIDPMRNFSISVSFSSLGSSPSYEPTFAVWTYGESQRGMGSALTHRYAPSTDPITEFDVEMGSDPNTGQAPATPNQMYMRPGSYIGDGAGGHNEILPPGGNWVLMPNFWQKNSTGSFDSYILTISGTWVDGHLILKRSIENTISKEVTDFGEQDLGIGPFGAMYIRAALENPIWNAKSHILGTASVAIHNITIVQGEEIPENVKRSIPTSMIDYTWFTPGGGGGIAYTTFLPRTDYNFTREN